VIITTTPAVEGKHVKEYLGLVVGEAIVGANILKDITAGIRDIVGGRAGSYEKELKKAREIALQEMSAEAKKLGANAIVGIDLDYETIGGMLMVNVSGTAVVVK